MIWQILWVPALLLETLENVQRVMRFYAVKYRTPKCLDGRSIHCRQGRGKIGGCSGRSLWGAPLPVWGGAFLYEPKRFASVGPGDIRAGLEGRWGTCVRLLPIAPVWGFVQCHNGVLYLWWSRSSLASWKLTAAFPGRGVFYSRHVKLLSWLYSC